MYSLVSIMLPWAFVRRPAYLCGFETSNGTLQWNAMSREEQSAVMQMPVWVAYIHVYVYGCIYACTRIYVFVRHQITDTLCRKSPKKRPYKLPALGYFTISPHTHTHTLIHTYSHSQILHCIPTYSLQTSTPNFGSNV